MCNVGENRASQGKGRVATTLREDHWFEGAID